MSNIRYIGTNFDSGLRVPNYVNGRTLHAEDLYADQSATRTRLEQLAQAVGYGIVEGLTVQQTPGSTNSLQVDPGIGINLRGDIIQLAGNPVTLSLVIAPETSSIAGNAGLFQPCETATPGENVTIDTGAYLLTVIPVSRLEGTTPLNTAAQRGNTLDCAAKWVVAGLEFKAIRLTDFGNNGVDASNNANTRRNRLAHWCLGSKALGVFPYPDYDGAYSGIDRISADDLTPCDLPLAVFYWATGSLSFVDTWSARRRMAQAFITPAWSGFFGEKRNAEGEARILQFQTQLTSLTNSVNPATIQAQTYFAHLPPLGFLPALPPANVLDYVSGRLLALILTGGTTTSENDYPFPNQFWMQYWPAYKTTLVNSIRDYVLESGNPSINLPTFWGELLPAQIELINLEQVDTMLQQAWHYDAITLAQRPAIRLYYPEEYLLQYIGKLLLDEVPSQFPGYDVLEVAHIFAQFLRNNTLQTPADQWLLLSLSTYLDMPQPVLTENIQRDDLVQIMFAKASADTVSFDLPRDADDSDGRPLPIGNNRPGVASAGGISAAALESRVSQPGITADAFLNEMASAAQATTRKRGGLARGLKRISRRRGRR